MSLPKWATIAKNEYRMRTSSIRQIRPFFPFLVIGALALFVLYIAPMIVNLFVDELVAFFLSQVAVAVVQIMLFMFFLFFMWFPVSFMLRDIRAEQQGILLSAPISPSDILLGEFLGELPLYAILVTIVTGFFTALLAPVGITTAQKVVIVAVFVIVLSSGLWIGTVIAALLRTKLGRTSRGKDVGKALAVLVALPFVGIMYAFMGGGVFEALADPKTGGIVKAVLAVFPSTWGADIITDFASNSDTAGLELMVRFGSLLIFFGASLWVGVKVADRAYSMETTTFTAAQVNPDGAFYKTVKHLGGGGSFGTLLTSTLKVFSRRFQNLSWIAYIVGIAVLINVFLLRPDEPVIVIMMGTFILALLAAVVTSDVTLRGKETLFIYKKIPSGIGKLVKMRLVQGWLIAIPIVVVVMALSMILIPQITPLSALAYTGLAMLIATAYMALALGLFLLMPAYTERGGEFMLNIMIMVQGSIFLFLGCLIMLGEIRGMLTVLISSWLLGVIILYFGKRHLERME